LVDRSARALGSKTAPVKIPPAPESSDPATLRRFAAKLGQAMAGLEERLTSEIGERTSLEARLLEEATAAVLGLVEPVTTIDALAEAVNTACRAATADAATWAHRAEELATRLEGKKQLLEEAGQHEVRARLFKVLAQELRADRLIAFLQVEALQLLAAAGSERLAGLSDGRYRLVCRDDEFSVVDTWNGDEERSVRTLSGGETFLASLALALALADQVRSLSVTDRATLDSLFLDEGFGTLDPESLRTVTEAIEQLGGDGRLVGVITHVKEFAEQFPRIEVTKSPAGSRLQLVP
jgi:exonuclease SbcC